MSELPVDDQTLIAFRTNTCRSRIVMVSLPTVAAAAWYADGLRRLQGAMPQTSFAFFTTAEGADLDRLPTPVRERYSSALCGSRKSTCSLSRSSPGKEAVHHKLLYWEMLVLDTVARENVMGAEDKAVAVLMWAVGANAVRGGTRIESQEYTPEWKIPRIPPPTAATAMTWHVTVGRPGITTAMMWHQLNSASKRLLDT